MRRYPPLILLCGLAACAAPRPEAAAPPAPGSERAGGADPGRQAVLVAAWSFADTGRLAGQPAGAARAAADLEWMAAALPQDQAWIPATPVLFPMLQRARAEVRGTLGITQAAPPAQVTQSLGAAAAALDAGSRAGAAAALAPVAADGQATLARLDRLPDQPQAAAATALAQSELQRMMRDDPE